MTFSWVDLPIKYITWRCIVLKNLSSWSLMKPKSVKRLRLIMIKREEVNVKALLVCNSKKRIGVLQ